MIDTFDRGGQPVALSHQNATEASKCATGGFGKNSVNSTDFHDHQTGLKYFMTSYCNCICSHITDKKTQSIDIITVNSKVLMRYILIKRLVLTS